MGSELTGNKFDSYFMCFPRFYTDFGKYITQAKSIVDPVLFLLPNIPSIPYQYWLQIVSNSVFRTMVSNRQRKRKEQWADYYVFNR